ncbi:hypothetical protein [Xanthomonas bonasiae]|uniref:hypothetical protein n=1 Tax=Xanthomonas bonasiae TaxID=2810351 RepID=UPI00198039F1|nr:hypothetical protein [Xanthomonas bonasiae]MBN6111391.1 hypothetical protein [Xanthomonas bonasiae]
MQSDDQNKPREDEPSWHDSKERSKSAASVMREVLSVASDLATLIGTAIDLIDSLKLFNAVHAGVRKELLEGLSDKDRYSNADAKELLAVAEQIMQMPANLSLLVDFIKSYEERLKDASPQILHRLTECLVANLSNLRQIDKEYALKACFENAVLSIQTLDATAPSAKTIRQL